MWIRRVGGGQGGTCLFLSGAFKVICDGCFVSPLEFKRIVRACLHIDGRLARECAGYQGGWMVGGVHTGKYLVFIHSSMAFIVQ